MQDERHNVKFDAMVQGFYLAKFKENLIVEMVDLLDKVIWWAKLNTKFLKKNA
jgi:hypothetical protein